MGYALLYAGLNFGAMLTGPMSAKVRTTQDIAYKAGQQALGLRRREPGSASPSRARHARHLHAIGMTKKTEANIERGQPGSEKERLYRRGEPEDLADEAGARRSRRSRNPRFLFFIFALLPVRTLFAHQWLTMPEYVLRSYPQDVADKHGVARRLRESARDLPRRSHARGADEEVPRALDDDAWLVR